MNTARSSASASTPPANGPRGAGTKGIPRARREEQILAAAVDEFGRHGHASASMAAIAGRVGVTKPMLYTYFGSKDGLYLACLERVAPRLVTAIEEAMAGEHPRAETPHRVLSAVFEVLEEQRGAWFVLYDRTLRPGTDLHAAAHRHRRTIDDLAASGTADLLRERGNDDPLDADALKHVWTGTVGALVGWWTGHPDRSARDMAARCARLLTAIRG
ncbi:MULTISPECIES: TetR/AcrR family transcriptional regulator [unclassified Streptomyces]|uniref:TetR/AcrR family transcriptional regulator n=1 Tax=unclassified Streptomyces TaxID=2593676 RepID=UPI0035D82A70